MGDNIGNLLIEYLRRLDPKVAVLADDLREARAVLSGVIQILTAHDAHMLRVEMRLGRIEKRLDLVDPTSS